MPYLEEAWVKFIKDDVFKYTKSRFSALVVGRGGLAEEQGEGVENESEDELRDLFDKIPEPDLEVEGASVWLRRPWIGNFLALSSGNKVARRELTEEERLERQERMRAMEMERRKALKRAKKRRELEKLKSESLDRVCLVLYLDGGFSDAALMPLDSGQLGDDRLEI